MGTWIEMKKNIMECLRVGVVPYVGTWIEIKNFMGKKKLREKSFPTWERG